MSSIMNLIHRPLPDADLRTLLGNDLKILKYSQPANYADLDQLLTKPTDYCIILYEEHLNEGHWTGLCKYNDMFEHFDSYGVSPDSELKWISSRLRQQLKENVPYLSNLLRKHAYLYNTMKFQSREHSVNTCGSHVAHRLFRLRNEGMNLKQYQDYMKELKKQTQMSYDYIVADWVKSELN